METEREGQWRDWTQNNVGTPDEETKGRDDLGYTRIKSGQWRDWTQNNVGTPDEETKGRDDLGYTRIKSEPPGSLDTPLHTDHQMSLCSESDTDDSEDWREASNSQSDSNSVENPKTDVREETDAADRTSLIYSRCGRKCTSKAKLTQRKKSCSGPLTCSLCGNRFETRRKLWYHMRIHSRGKPFICPQCGKGFSWKGQWRDWTQNNVGTPDEETKGRDDLGYTRIKSGHHDATAKTKG
ncbi:zinc finger protein 614-like isoform X4 [Synchiropus splendidus]|uniref:zinc finger protein 614-like isoform X4 n=1 Tax=Synchiropus splendidus TaxID=270530 RepID=UPI00237EBD43|nr:zinc finger protein 614-like isoform X4 [Synchiropus splendidus]